MKNQDKLTIKENILIALYIISLLALGFLAAYFENAVIFFPYFLISILTIITINK